MLILVGVTINYALNGGIINKAKQASSQMQIEADREALLSCVIASMGLDGKVDFTELDTEVAKIGFTGTNGTYTSKAGNTFAVDEDGNITYTGGGNGSGSGTENADLAYLRTYIGQNLEDIADMSNLTFNDSNITLDESFDGSPEADTNDNMLLPIRYKGNLYSFVIDGSGLNILNVVTGYNPANSENDSDDSSSSEDSEGTIGLDYNNNSIVLGPGVEVIAYENLEYLNSTEANLGTNLKNAVDSGKVSAVLREEEKSNGLDYIAVIPTGFTVSSISGENTILGGLVVSDSVGNEFVWIPVQDISQMAMPQEQGSSNYRGVLYDWNTDSTGQTQYSWSSSSEDYREPANLTYTTTINKNDVAYDSQEAFTEYGGGIYTNTMYQTEFNSMVESVAKYKGFYVGRYETGGFNVSTIVVKAGEKNNSINNAYWYKMYQMQKDFASSNLNVASTMIWGCQYDQVLKFLDDKEDGAGNTFDVTTYNQSRHTNSLAATGNNTNDKVQNIYDLEGNVYEWTLEAGNIDYRVRRGGDCSDSDYSAYRFSFGSPNNYDNSSREPSHTLYKVIVSHLTLPE